MFNVVQNKSRLFTFGCSFTRHFWTTWPQVLGKHFQIPLYNYGQAAAGNMYIFNHIMQADCYYNFQPEDIIAVCWTNVCREDRYVIDGWHSSGNVFNSNQFDPEWVKRWCRPNGMAIRDYALIKAAHNFIKTKTGNNNLFLSMCDLVNRTDQWSDVQHDTTQSANLYKDTIEQVKPSFYDILWQNNLINKQKYDQDVINFKFLDGHPSPEESLKYLESVADIEFDNGTKSAVHHAQKNWQDYMKNCVNNTTQEIFRPYQMSQDEKNELKTKTCIWAEEIVERL